MTARAKKRPETWVRERPGVYRHLATGHLIVNHGVGWFAITPDGIRLFPPFESMKAGREWIDELRAREDQKERMFIRGEAIR